MLRTTNKQVIAYLKDHVLENFATDNGYDNPDRVANLRHQLDSMRQDHQSIYQTALNYAERGGYLIYYYDVQKQLKEWLDHSSGDPEYSDDKAWRLYCHLVARTMAKLYTEGE